MTVPRVARARAPRLAVVCFGLERTRARQQPWHIALGLARGLHARGARVVLVSDATDPPREEAFAILQLPRLFAGGRASPELCRLVTTLGIERAFLITGAFRLARMRPLALPCWVTLILASPRLRLRELIGLSPADLWRERRFLLLPLINALLPGFLLRRGFHRSQARDIVYLSEAARSRYVALGLPRGALLRPQVTMPEPGGMSKDRRPQVLYLGPALAARGVDLAIAAFEQARARGLDGELLLLIRPDGGSSALRWLKRRLARSPFASSIRLETRMLSASEVSAHLAAARVLLAPFRAPVSDVPLVVIEGALAGCTPVALDAPGVGEYARALGGLVVSSPAELTDALLRAWQRPSSPPPDARPWTSWEKAVEPLLETCFHAIARYRLIALCGVDGSGKTSLVRALGARLAAAGISYTPVWSRFRNYLSKPLLALARLTGHNRKERHHSFTIGYHDFRETWYAKPFLALQTIDLTLDIALRFRRRDLVVADRCCLDTIVDLCIDTGYDEFILEHLVAYLVRLLPQPAAAVVIERAPRSIAMRRPDALADRHFFRRRALYRRLAERLRIPVISNDGLLEDTVEKVITAVIGGSADLALAR